MPNRLKTVDYSRVFSDSTSMPDKPPVRKWEVFPGRNKFYCNGRIMLTPYPDCVAFFLTVFCIVGTSTLFFVYDCQFLTKEISPAIPAVAAVLLFFVMSTLFRTSFTDPGIIPRLRQDEAADIERQIEALYRSNFPAYRSPPHKRIILIRGERVMQSHCYTCNIFRPPRASHCGICDNCVEVFDHHCPFVGNCVGKRNYRYFYLFLLSINLLSGFAFACVITHLVLLSRKSKNATTIHAVRQSPASVVVGIVCFFSICALLPFAVFQTYLIICNITSREYLRGIFRSKQRQKIKNPYRTGSVMGICCSAICGPDFPSLIDRRGEYVEDSQLSQRYHNGTVKGEQEKGVASAVVAIEQKPQSAPGTSNAPMYSTNDSYRGMLRGSSNHKAAPHGNKVATVPVAVVSPQARNARNFGAQTSTVAISSYPKEDQDPQKDGSQISLLTRIAV